jgi:hypothetical protein
MTIFPPNIGGNWKITPVLVVLILSVLSALAGDTNEIRVGTLPAGGRFYTNATITRVTPAYAVVSYQEGMVQIPMSNMPAAYQTEFGYTPEAAAQFLDEEKQMQKKRRAAVLAQQAALQARMGTNRPVRITAIDDNPSFGGIPFCTTDAIKGGMLVENLPDSVRQFMAGYRQLQADIADCQQRLNKLKVPEPPPTNTVPQPPRLGKKTWVSSSAGFSRIIPKDDNTAAIRRDTEDRLKTLNARLAQATADYNRNTTILAHPSGQSYGGKPIWVCVGLPPASTR